MKILHVTPYFEPAWAFGGVARAVTAVARAQADAGHDVTVLTTDAMAARARCRQTAEIMHGVRVLRVRNLSLRARATLNLSTPPGMARQLRQLRDRWRCDVVHCHEVRSVETALAAHVFRRANVPVVLSPHGTLPRQTGRSWAKRAWDALLGRHVLRRVHHVVALTATERADALKAWARAGVPLPLECVSVVPNGVHVAPPPTPDQIAAARARWQLDTDRVIAFVGRLVERKGPAELLRAFALLPPDLGPLRLILVGPDHGAGELRGLATRLGVDTSVTFTGAVPPDDVARLLGVTSVLALPAIGEGLPMAVLEALAASVPVVIGPGSGMTAAELDGAGLVTAIDPRAIADALAAVLTDPARRSSMARHARALALARFDIRAIVRDLDAIYATAGSRLS